MREVMIDAMIKHAEGQIAKHKSNVLIYMNSAVGVGEHTDILESIEKELNAMGKYQEQIDIIEKYFLDK
jgi:hypothetical protein|tara:strand:+ start:48 stop:254 length:207 start_codon:yes stop_codon:yes gene_type:complete